MTFICYSVTVGLLAFAYQQPDLFCMAAMLVVAKLFLWRSR